MRAYYLTYQFLLKNTKYTIGICVILLFSFILLLVPDLTRASNISTVKTGCFGTVMRVYSALIRNGS